MAGDTVELQQMHEIILNYSEYFKCVHYPLEAYVVEYVRRRDTNRRHIMEEVPKGDDELTHHAAVLSSLLDEALHDGIMLREDLVHVGWQFLDAKLVTWRTRSKPSLYAPVRL